MHTNFSEKNVVVSAKKFKGSGKSFGDSRLCPLSRGKSIFFLFLCVVPVACSTVYTRLVSSQHRYFQQCKALVVCLSAASNSFLVFFLTASHFFLLFFYRKIMSFVIFANQNLSSWFINRLIA